MSTATITGYEGVCDDLLRGVPGLAVRVGNALQSWGRRTARPLDREAQRLAYAARMSLEAERREAVVRGSLLGGSVYR